MTLLHRWLKDLQVQRKPWSLQDCELHLALLQMYVILSFYGYVPCTKCCQCLESTMQLWKVNDQNQLYNCERSIFGINYTIVKNQCFHCRHYCVLMLLLLQQNWATCQSNFSRRFTSLFCFCMGRFSIKPDVYFIWFQAKVLLTEVSSTTLHRQGLNQIEQIQDACMVSVSKRVVQCLQDLLEKVHVHMNVVHHTPLI